MTLPEALAEIERLRALLAKYEALAAIALGTLTAPNPPPDLAFTVTWNEPPTTPR